MFDSLVLAPADSIMGITEAFKLDSSPHKINLSMGVFKDETGHTPILESVKEAEVRILAAETSKSYSAIEGFPVFNAAVISFMFGEDHNAVTEERALTAHTPGGSGALRVIGDFLYKMNPGASVWVSDPTWANHINIFETAGFKVKQYPYFDASTNGLAYEKMLATLKEIPAGDIVLYHGCCHNPTGVDPTVEQWSEIADITHSREIIPILDFAYQGFSRGIRQDAAGPFQLIGSDNVVFICGSFSKNFALYNERTGSLTAVTGSKKHSEILMSHIKIVVRSIYSSPPAHGGIIVSTILNDPQLRSQWEQELAQMRDRIHSMRKLLADTLAKKGLPGDQSYITRQNGMFSFSGLDPAQVQRLQDEHSVYIVGNGRINVAAITPDNIEPLCNAIVAVS